MLLFNDQRRRQRKKMEARIIRIIGLLAILSMVIVVYLNIDTLAGKENDHRVGRNLIANWIFTTHLVMKYDGLGYELNKGQIYKEGQKGAKIPYLRGQKVTFIRTMEQSKDFWEVKFKRNAPKGYPSMVVHFRQLAEEEKMAGLKQVILQYGLISLIILMFLIQVFT